MMMEQNRIDWDQHFAALKDGDCDIGIDVHAPISLPFQASQYSSSLLIELARSLAALRGALT